MGKITIKDIYEALPKTNCGECGYPSCYIFSTKVLLQGENPEKCPYLDKETSRKLLEMLEEHGKEREKVWGESLRTLREKLSKENFKELAENLGGVCGSDEEGEYIKMKFFGEDVKVYRNTIKKMDGSPLDPWSQVLALVYLTSGGRGEPEGKWVSLSELPSGMVKYRSFRETVEKPLARLFQENPQRIDALCQKLGGKRERFGDEDAGFTFNVLPKVPLLVLFWKEEKEEGFPAKVSILFDRSAGKFIDVEAASFIGERLVELSKDIPDSH